MEQVDEVDVGEQVVLALLDSSFPRFGDLAIEVGNVVWQGEEPKSGKQLLEVLSVDFLHLLVRREHLLLSNVCLNSAKLFDEVLVGGTYFLKVLNHLALLLQFLIYSTELFNCLYLPLLFHI